METNDDTSDNTERIGTILGIAGSVLLLGGLCLMLYTPFALYNAGAYEEDLRREVRREVMEEYQARFKTWERDHLADAVKAGYGEWYINPMGQNEFRWKPKPKAPEQAVRSHEEAVEIIRNKRYGQWLALPNGAIINLETGDKE